MTRHEQEDVGAIYDALHRLMHYLATDPAFAARYNAGREEPFSPIGMARKALTEHSRYGLEFRGAP